MTRDEAIAVLQEEIDGNLELTIREWRERDEQKLFPALRMAIEALMHDIRTETHGVCLISKDDAIKEISKGVWNEYELIDRIKALPSAEAIQGWIPLSHDDDGLGTDFPYERDGEWVIVTDGKNISVERIKKDAYDHFFPNGRWFELEDAIAWQPLPKLYECGARMEANE